MISWIECKRKLKELSDYSHNPRKMSKKAFDHLVKSIKEDGYHHRILIDTNNTIIGGHSRTKALRKAGYKDGDDIDCLMPSQELTPQEFDRINIRDNLGYGEFDMDILSDRFEAEELVGWGFPEDLLDFDVHTEVSEEDEEAGEYTESECKTKLGDIYQLGRHRLMCGDATDTDAIDKLIDGQVMDCVYTDPPYGISLLKKEGVLGASSQVYQPVLGDDSIDAARDSYNICKAMKIEQMLFWGGNHYSECLPSSKCWVVWNKMPDEMHISFADCELAWTNFDNQARVFNHVWTGFCKASESGEKRIHPTQKPVALAVEIFEFFKLGKNVLDLFGGSGSTLIAAEKSGRDCFMMELSPNYCDSIINRWEKLTNLEAVLTNGL